MGEEKAGLIRTVWNGPFHVGPLSRPVSVGDVLLKLLETLWRTVLLVLAVVVAGAIGILAWAQFIEPAFFPPLKSQISAVVSYDDGSAKLPPADGEKPFRCTPDYPIKIAFHNNSNKSVGHIDFAIEGRSANRSSNVVEGGAWRQADPVTPAGYTWQSCWAVSVQQGYDPKALDYKVEIWGATEADASARFKPVAASSTESPEPKPSAAATASSIPSPNSSVSLGTIKDADWQKIGMGCSCSFSVGMPREEKLIAGGDGRTFFRLNGTEHLCPAPDTQSMFDGSVSMSCGPAAVRVSPYGKVKPGYDGHSSSARLHIAHTAGTLSLTGTWSCGC